MGVKVGIIGCGLIGHKRAKALAGAELSIVCDLDLPRAQRLAGDHPGCIFTSDQADVWPHCDLVVVATANNQLSPIALEAVRHGKHVLVEKPGAISSVALAELAAEAELRRVVVTVGYNHRFHPALQKAKILVAEGAVGPLMFLRGRYGHGGRVGYEHEWRADPAISGGGELIDQGVHLIDLALWFLGSFTKVAGAAHTYFWPMPVDDNAFLHLETAVGQTAWLHVSCTEWKNLFSLEIYGRDGKLQIEGLGGSYGVERLSFYRMLPEMGPPETTIWEYPRGDSSWAEEMQAVLHAIEEGVSASTQLRAAIETLKIVEQVYAQSAPLHLQ